MAEISVMRMHDGAVCGCQSDGPPANVVVPQLSSRQQPCPRCHDVGAAAVVRATRRTLTELVAAQRGYALHRRTLPETGSEVDHLFVGPSGVFVIDVLDAPDAVVSVPRRHGWDPSLVERLTVDGSPAAHLLDAVRTQCAEVADGLATLDQRDVPVIPVLCFVGAQLPRRARRRRVGDVRLTTAATLADEVVSEGPLDADLRFALAMSLVSFIPSPA